MAFDFDRFEAAMERQAEEGHDARNTEIADQLIENRQAVCKHRKVHKCVHEGQYLEQCEDCGEILN